MIEVALIEQYSTEGRSGGGVFGMNLQTGTAGLHGLVEPARSPQLFGQGGKCQRRRILLDPAS